jgi:hypothetical protein
MKIMSTLKLHVQRISNTFGEYTAYRRAQSFLPRIIDLTLISRILHSLDFL